MPLSSLYKSSTKLTGIVLGSCLLEELGVDSTETIAGEGGFPNRDWGVDGLPNSGVEERPDWGVVGVTNWGVASVPNWGVAGVPNWGVAGVGLSSLVHYSMRVMRCFSFPSPEYV